jgi:hypothetical protein
MDLPADVKARRDVEDKAIRMGRKRGRLEAQLEQSIPETVALMDEADRAGISIDHLAELVRVSRPTLYRWRQAIVIHREDRAEAPGRER